MRKRLYELGCAISDFGANLAGHLAAIFSVAAFCLAWFLLGGPNGENSLTVILSVLAITLTQMVLNQQRRSERALHIKIDELILSMSGARDEVAGIEGMTEDQLEGLRRPVAEMEPNTPVCLSHFISTSRVRYHRQLDRR